METVFGVQSKKQSQSETKPSEFLRTQDSQSHINPVPDIISESKSKDVSMESSLTSELQSSPGSDEDERQHVCNSPCCSEISEPYQPNAASTLKKTTTKPGRSFSFSWFHEYPWLTLCTTRNKVFCFYCRLAYGKDSDLQKHPTSRQPEATFISEGFNNWKKSGDKFKKHDKSSYHRDALAKHKKHGNDSVTSLLLAKVTKEQQCRRNLLLVQLSCLLFLSRQGLALRGHIEEESNLFQLLKLRGSDIEGLPTWLSEKTYMSPAIVNEQLMLLGRAVRLKILERIKAARFFAVMADETRDISNKEQVVICIRWVDNDFSVHEDAIGLYVVPSTTSATLTEVLKDTLIRCDLPLSNCRGQGYDGASNFQGHVNGVAVQLQREEPRAVHVHCLAHCINLALQEATRACKPLRDALDITIEVNKLIKYSPNENTYSRIFKKLHPLRSVLTWMCLKLKELVAYDLCVQHVGHVETTAKDAQKGAEQELAYYDKLRSTDTFSEFYKSVVDEAEDKTDPPRLPRYRKRPKRLDDGSNTHTFPSVEDYYRQQYFEGLDIVSEQLKRRFSQKGFNTAVEIEQLLLSAANGRNFQISSHIRELYKDDVDFVRLNTQLSMLHDTVKSVSTERGCLIIEVTNIDTVVSVINSSPVIRHLFKEISTLLKIYLTIPVTTATSERTFSTLRRLKSYVRSTMTQERLNNVLLLHVHKTIADELSLVDVAREFISFNDRRRNYFGLFS
ncbi:zinc finger MYM-type protein 1-like [Haliotis rubra]|uniref:zinc finger MYM-type protein 1-like n=1 Tax=Haliotis rubra TaxID=36100 RepID=UPI001EE55A80|nr:zinc finger MYM-type protein 1-like [Haliotis rubra]